MNINNNFSNNIRFQAVTTPMTTAQNGSQVQSETAKPTQNNAEYFWPSAKNTDENKMIDNQ